MKKNAMITRGSLGYEESTVRSLDKKGLRNTHGSVTTQVLCHKRIRSVTERGLCDCVSGRFLGERLLFVILQYG